MNKNTLKGNLKELKGKIKESFGKATNQPTTELGGKKDRFVVMVSDLDIRHWINTTPDNRNKIS